MPGTVKAHRRMMVEVYFCHRAVGQGLGIQDSQVIKDISIAEVDLVVSADKTKAFKEWLGW